MLVAANKQLYITLPKRQKMLLSRSIVNAVRSQNPPGRFLQKEGKTKLWFDVGDQRAQEKTSQALREGAPDIRKKVAAAKAAGTGSNSTSPTVTPKAPVSGDSSDLGAKTEVVEKTQIPVHSSEDRKPESTGSSSITGSGMHPSISESQQYRQQQQQMNGMYGNHSGTGHMTLNERGIMIQNAMMNGGRGLNGQNHSQMNNNDNNYNHSAFMYQQHQQGQFQQQMHQQQDYRQQYQYQQQGHNNNVGFPDDRRQNQYHQQQQYHDNGNGSMSNYDNFVAPPSDELERDGISFGSLHMTDAEMHRLQQGSSHGLGKSSRHSISRNSNRNSNGMPAAPMGGILEPTGISFGDVSMHSAATNFTMKLEENGTSFGTLMSYNTLNTTNPDMVDGGLMDAVGTSFGSLSLDKNNRDMLFKTLEIAGGGSEVPPMFRAETKSSGNLLDCSDTESESSRDKEELTKQKSQAWEMMKTQLDKQTSKGTINSQDLMPPPPTGVQQNNGNNNSNKNEFDNIEIALPPTTMEANFSTLSAWSAADDEYNEPPSATKKENTNATSGNGVNGQEDAAAIPPPPPELVKVDSF